MEHSATSDITKRSYVLELLTDFLFKNNEEYGFKKFAKKDAENIINLIEQECTIVWNKRE
jgi:hypothetical protein